MTSVPSKRSKALVYLLCVIVVAMASVIGHLKWRVDQSAPEIARLSRSLANAEEAIKEQRAVFLDRGQFPPLTTIPTPSEEPDPEVEPEEGAVPEALLQLATSTRERFLDLFPLKLEKEAGIIEIAPDMLVVRTGGEQRPSAMGVTVWLVDVNKQTIRRVFRGGGGDCSDLQVNSWKNGFAVKYGTSPCEAVGRVRVYYYDQQGNLLAETDAGNFERQEGHSGATVDVQVGTKALFGRMVQGKPCLQPEPMNEFTVWPPTTTVVGIEVNKRLYKLPKPIGVECQLGYGDSVDDMFFPALDEFDGSQFTFRLPGYDAVLTSQGTVSYTQRTAYVLKPHSNRLVREDATGLRVVRENLLVDPLFSGLLPLTKTYVEYSSSILRTEGDRLVVKVEKFNYPEYRYEDAGITFDYNTKTDMIENLRVE